MSLHICARYENKVLKPDHDLPLKEGERVIIEIRRCALDRMYGILSTDKNNADTIIAIERSDYNPDAGQKFLAERARALLAKEHRMGRHLFDSRSDLYT